MTARDEAGDPLTLRDVIHEWDVSEADRRSPLRTPVRVARGTRVAMWRDEQGGCDE